MRKEVSKIVIARWACMRNMSNPTINSGSSLTKKDMEEVKQFLSGFKPTELDRQKLEVMMSNGTKPDCLYGEKIDIPAEICLLRDIEKSMNRGKEISIRVIMHSDYPYRNNANGVSAIKRADYAEVFIESEKRKIELRFNYKYMQDEMSDYIKVTIKQTEGDKELDRMIKNDLIEFSIYSIGSALAGVNNLEVKKALSKTAAIELSEVYKKLSKQKIGEFKPELGIFKVNLKEVYSEEERFAMLKDIYNKHRHENEVMKIESKNGSLEVTMIVNGRLMQVIMNPTEQYLIYEM